jgi:hypothetical protein
MIHIELLKESDKGKSVVYAPFDFSRPDRGIITGWDEKYIFVRFTNVDKPYPVNPEDLTFENK